jgi:hypothetical protein
MYFFSKARADAQNYRYGFQISSNKLRTFLQGNGGPDITPIGSTTLISGVWYMVTTVINRSSNITMYINGVQETLTGNSTVSQWNGLNFQSNNPARVGSYTGSGNILPVFPFKGDISSVHLYFRNLSQQEILQNYYAGLERFIPTNGLVLSLDAQNTNLYATSPTTAYDISGNYNNGSLINGVQYVGNGDGSWGFDGVNDYINIPNTASLQVTGDQTLVFWVYPERGVGRQNFYAKAYAGEGTITYESNGSMNYYYGTAGNDGSPYQGVNSGVVMATLNTWYFVVLVRELSTPTKTIKWYVNAVLRNTTTAIYSSATAGSSPITIGTGYAGRFLGKVGLVYQYNKALTQTEITTIFNATRTRYGI